MPHPAAFVNGKTHGIPQVGGNLPLVDQMRLFAFKEQGRHCLGHLEIIVRHVLILHVDDARGRLLRRSRLATPFGSFDKDCACRKKFSLQQFIRDPRSVFVSCHTLSINGERN